jgi:hypothetical protein
MKREELAPHGLGGKLEFDVPLDAPQQRRVVILEQVRRHEHHSKMAIELTRAPRRNLHHPIPMTAPRYESTISLGYIVQIVSLVIAGATAGGVDSGTLEYLELQRGDDRQRTEALDIKIQVLERTTDVFKADLNYIRLAVDGVKHGVNERR